MIHIGKNAALLLARFTLCLFVIWSNAAVAAEFENARIAAELFSSSENLSHQIDDARGYDKVKIQAGRLGREAMQLADAINRGRSVSFVESQIKAVFRRYGRLETSFLRANYASPDPQLYSKVAEISDLYVSLSIEVQRSTSYSRHPNVYLFTPPFITEHTISNDWLPRVRINPNGTNADQERAQPQSDPENQ
ncbi:MAG: hypothetical protein GKR91_10925 [Pseudomonadales bacterium]|nr:hypothetical protein [Pseudomonadales bacterium]